MSRNLNRTECKFCSGRVVLIEPMHRPTLEDFAEVFHAQYGRMRFAKASCEDCQARYLAWDCSGCIRPGHHLDECAGFSDLSHHSTFNDEPGKADMPLWRITRGVVRKEPWV